MGGAETSSHEPSRASFDYAETITHDSILHQDYADLWDSDLDAVAGSLDAARNAAVDAHELNTERVTTGGTGKNSGAVLALHR